MILAVDFSLANVKKHALHIEEIYHMLSYPIHCIFSHVLHSFCMDVFRPYQAINYENVWWLLVSVNWYFYLYEQVNKNHLRPHPGLDLYGLLKQPHHIPYTEKNLP